MRPDARSRLRRLGGRPAALRNVPRLRSQNACRRPDRRHTPGHARRGGHHRHRGVDIGQPGPGRAGDHGPFRARPAERAQPPRQHRHPRRPSLAALTPGHRPARRRPAPPPRARRRPARRCTTPAAAPPASALPAAARPPPSPYCWLTPGPATSCRRAEATEAEMLFPTTLVGSYPQPDWLIDRERLAGRFPPRVRARELWRVDPAYLAQAQRDATLLAIRAQEDAGLDVITDGEICRESYSNRFATALD